MSEKVEIDKHKIGGVFVFDARGNGDGDIVPTITGDHENRVTDYIAVCVGNGQTNNISMAEVMYTLDTMHDQQAVIVFDKEMYNHGEHMQGVAQAREDTVSPTVRADAHPSGVCARNVVRRLSPLECTRLQSYPDGWVDIGEWRDDKGKMRKDSDAAKYKALGNSICLPFWYWLLGRIMEHCEEKTMGSLFDGISGFPLCWESVNGEGSCRWTSEIEPFCIAVSKKHFGDEATGERGDLYEA